MVALKLVAICTVGVILLPASLVNAAVVYDESTQGDLPEQFTLSPQLNFLPGSNQILGTFGKSSMQGDFDSDTIRFMVPNGDEVTSVTLTTTLPGNSFVVFYYLTSPSGSRDEVGASVPGSAPIFTEFMPLAAGTSNVAISGYGGFASLPAIAAYTWDFEVQPVPEPSTLTLLALGIVGLVVVRRGHVSKP